MIMINTKWILCSLSCFRQGKQRVSIAKASSNDPEIIFADEPIGNLDLASAVNIMQCFMKINSETAALWTSTAICGGLPFPQAAKGNDLEIHSYSDFRRILLTFNPISPILLSKQGDYSVVEKVKPDPLNLLANTNVGS